MIRRITHTTFPEGKVDDTNSKCVIFDGCGDIYYQASLGHDPVFSGAEMAIFWKCDKYFIEKFCRPKTLPCVKRILVDRAPVWVHPEILFPKDVQFYVHPNGWRKFPEPRDNVHLLTDVQFEEMLNCV